MKWRRPTQADPNVTVERGGGSGGGTSGGFPFPTGGGGGRGGRGGLGIGGGGLILVVIAIFVLKSCLGGSGGVNGIPFPIQNIPPVTSAQSEPATPELPAAPGGDELTDFMIFVFGDVQNMWGEEFRKAGQTFKPARMRIFDGQTVTGCGQATSATGPFYCRLDQTVYLDTTFFQELSQRFNAPGDFAQAYVVAHEMGHHIQEIVGISDAVDQRRAQDPDLANDLSIRLELQADCLAGVWAYSAYKAGALEAGDVEEALAAAQGVGDDRIQEQAQGRITPETWTHGSAEQRQKWLKLGFESGNSDKCDTFAVDSP